MSETTTMTISIERVSDHKVVTYDEPIETQYVDHQEFWWSKGNGSCDCNRALFFSYNAPKGESFPKNYRPSCGEGKYRVRVMHGTELIFEDKEFGK